MRKARSVLGLVGSSVAAARAVNEVRAARGSGDRLLLANAVASVAVVVTGGAIALRDLRREVRQ